MDSPTARQPEPEPMNIAKEAYADADLAEMNAQFVSRLIGIAGPSCSGKTALAHALAARLPAGTAHVLSLDAYYRDLSHLPKEARAQSNFDAPDALDHETLIRDLEALARGETVRIPRYDFDNHIRRPETEERAPHPVLIIEGIFALYWEEIRRLLDLKVFIHLADATCLQRRKQRDIQERGRTEPSVIAQYQTTVRPMYQQHAAPTRRHADITLDGKAPLEQSIARLLNEYAVNNCH